MLPFSERNPSRKSRRSRFRTFRKSEVGLVLPPLLCHFCVASIMSDANNTSTRKRLRNCCFTLNNPTETSATFAERIRNVLSPSYFVFQLEQGEQGTPHFQGYLEFPSPKSFNAIRHALNNAHIEARRGSAAQASDYCQKADSRLDGPWVFGELSAQGRRSDLSDAIASLRDSGLTGVAEQYPASFVKYSSGLAKLDALQHRFERRGEPPSVFLHYGPTDAGKTRRAYDNEPQLVRLSPELKWFDSYYPGDPAVLFDEFAGRMSHCELTRLLEVTDRYPLHLQVKGGHIRFNPSRIYFTTNIHPRDWYDYSKRETQYAALRRRFTTVVWWKSAGTEPLVLTPPHPDWLHFWSGPPLIPQRPLGPLDDYVIHPDPVDQFNF